MKTKVRVEIGLFDQVLSFSKTQRQSGHADGAKSYPPLLRKDIPTKTEKLRRLMLAPRINVKGGSVCLLPTPTVCGNWNRKGASKNSGDGLATVLRLLPTVSARDWNGEANPELYKKLRARRSKPLNDTLVNETGIRLTPEIAEWMMGWPHGWTGLRLLATGKCRCKSRRRG